MKNSMHLDSTKTPFKGPGAAIHPTMGSSQACSPSPKGKAPPMTSANAVMGKGGHMKPSPRG